MRKSGIQNCLIFFFALILIGCEQKPNTAVVQIKKLDNYPSASAIEYFDGKLYVMGDDATALLVLDTNLNIIGSVPIISYPGKRIPKEIKPDLEASALISDRGSTALFLLGSGSLSPFRNSGRRYLLETGTIDSILPTHGYELIKQSGIEQLNIEGACFISDSLLLASRGNKSYPKNYLIITDENFWSYTDSSLQVREIIVTEKIDTSSFQGVSGLCYSKLNDQLIMSVSTEDTRSVYEDGAIGKSYLWFVNNISEKISQKNIQPDEIIDLEKIDSRFKGQKIESVCVTGESKDFLHLVLAADNDDGSSTLFKMAVKKN